MDLVKRLEEYRDRERELQWEGTFAQYFEIATKKNEIAQLSHERIYHMIMDAGVETTEQASLAINSSPKRFLALRSRYSRSLTTSTPPPNAWRYVNVSSS